MRCTVCKKTSDEVPLFTGIMGAEMVMICEACAKEQKVPIIRKPSPNQLKNADKTYSVRERMEIMSGVRDATEISDDQIVTQKNLSRLRSPPKKQMHEAVLDNYYWALSMARRRKKLTVSHLAQKMDVEPKVIQNIEKGILPENFQELFMKLESYLGIHLLKMRRDKISFVRTNREAEQDILRTVRHKMEEPEGDDGEAEQTKRPESDDDEEEDLEITQKKDLSKITISDLLGRKRRREAREKRKREREEEAAMMGDDLDLEIEEF